MDEAEASVETIDGIQETMHSAEEAKTRDEGVQCTPSELEDMEVDKGTVQNILIVA